MRKFLKLCVVLVMVSITACTRNDDDLSPAAGDWKVNFYWDKKDETSDFNGWTLRLNSGGQVQAFKGSSTITGTWTETSTKFILNFGSDPLFSELNDDWQIQERTATSIKLKDDNPARDDQLHLIKL